MSVEQLIARARLNRRRALVGTAGGLTAAAVRSFAGPASGQATGLTAVSPILGGSVLRPHLPDRRHHLLATPKGFNGTLSTLAAATIGRVPPVPIPGGDVLGPPNYPPFQIHQFLPGDPTTIPGADGVNAEPNGITNFRGLVALAYTTGTATDNNGVVYPATTDIRAYQGEYVGADGTRAHGTFVEI